VGGGESQLTDVRRPLEMQGSERVRGMWGKGKKNVSLKGYEEGTRGEQEEKRGKRDLTLGET